MKVENLTDKELQDKLERIQDELDSRKKERLKKEREVRKIIGERRYRQVYEEYLKYIKRNGQPPNFVILHKEHKGLKELADPRLFRMHVILLNLDKIDRPIVFFDKIK
jgi:septal ring factor EnvC (AmiA/AmiB activator)